MGFQLPYQLGWSSFRISLKLTWHSPWKLEYYFHFGKAYSNQLVVTETLKFSYFSVIWFLDKLPPVKTNILLMEEILHQLIGSSHYLHGFVHHWWCRISSIHSSTWKSMVNGWKMIHFLSKWSLFRGHVYLLGGSCSEIIDVIISKTS